MTELKKCPFCGGEAELIELSNRDYYVQCRKCKAEQGKVYRAKQTAIKAWNRRASDE